MGVTTNPSVNSSVPPPSNTPPPDSTRPPTEGAKPPAEGARPPAEGAHPPANSSAASAANLGTSPPNQAQLDLANAFDNIQAQQSLINTETNAGSVETFQMDNQSSRADSSESHV